jgi:hypothetical protein
MGRTHLLRCLAGPRLGRRSQQAAHPLKKKKQAAHINPTFHSTSNCSFFFGSSATVTVGVGKQKLNRLHGYNRNTYFPPSFFIYLYLTRQRASKTEKYIFFSFVKGIGTTKRIGL